MVSYHKPQWKNTHQIYPSEGCCDWLSSAKTCIHQHFKNSLQKFQYTTYCNKKKCPGHLKLKNNCIMSQSRLLTLLLLTVSTIFLLAFFLHVFLYQIMTEEFSRDYQVSKDIFDANVVFPSELSNQINCNSSRYGLDVNRNTDPAHVS